MVREEPLIFFSSLFFFQFNITASLTLIIGARDTR